MAIDTIGANALASNSVTSVKIVADAITTAKIANDAVTAAKIPSGAVVADIADGGITTAKLADDAVTGGKLANDIAISTTGNIATTGSGTITSAGLITASGSIAVGGTGSANTLDDYEEGSFVPILKHEVGDALTVGYASGYTHGRYTKIGSLVTFQLTIDVDSVSGGASNQQLVVPNLPFTAKSYQTNSNGGANITYMANLNTNITYGIVLGSSTTIRFYSAPSTPSYGNTVTSSTYIQCYGQYETDA